MRPKPAAAKRAPWAKHERKLAAVFALLLAPLLAHAAVVATTRIEPPSIAAQRGEAAVSPAGLRTLGRAYARKRGRILEVRLEGAPEAIGHQHARLLYPEMVANEGVLYEQFRRYVPVAPVRWLLMDLSRLRFRGVDAGMGGPRRREIAAQAAGFAPDPYADVLPTYHRFVFLQSLYDIALSFERSPLLGCTSFALGDGAFADGHAVLARAFDFEAGPIFDEGKAVFLVHERGAIPYASVAWPGLVGAVTAMNAEGVALVVHGARAREARPVGEPVVHTMREVMARARTTAEAVTLLEGAPMVSHMVMLVDRAGDAAIVERAPAPADGAPPEKPFVRRGRGKVALTNHFEGPLAADPANQAVLARTSTRARRQRLDELLANLGPGADVQDVVRVLRDKKAAGGGALALGDRRALDALIATHGVVMDATARALWVSEGPHLAGRFVRFDVAALLDPGYEPSGDAALGPGDVVAEDPIVASGEYEAWRREGSPHGGEPERRKQP